MRIEIYTKSELLPELIESPALHSALMFRSYEKTKGCTPHMLVAYDENDKEIGHILVIKRKRFIPFPPMMSRWYNINGEGVYRADCTNREEIFAAFLKKVLEMFSFRHSFIKLIVPTFAKRKTTA